MTRSLCNWPRPPQNRTILNWSFRDIIQTFKNESVFMKWSKFKNLKPSPFSDDANLDD